MWRTGVPAVMHRPRPTGEDARPPSQLLWSSRDPFDFAQGRRFGTEDPQDDAGVVGLSELSHC
jgi:hypothetical protein